MNNQYFARVIHGLEQLAARDIEQHCKAQQVSISHRLIEFSSSAEPESLVQLRSVDDVFLSIGERRGISHTRSALADLAELGEYVDQVTLPARLTEANRGSHTSFSVTASFLGKRNYNRWDIEQALSECLVRRMGWRPISLREAPEEPVDIHCRVHIENERALLGVRIAERPLYKRAYKAEQARGSLTPPVAYLMAKLARESAGELLFDPACGVGTIPIEARYAGWQSAVGSDVDAALINMAQRNATGLEAIHFQQGDLFDASPTVPPADAIVCDLPWGGQTKLHSGSAVAAQSLLEQLLLRTKPQGVWVLMAEGQGATLAEQAQILGLKVSQLIPLSLFGRHPSIIVVELC